MVALAELVNIKGGGTPSKAVPEYWAGDIPWASVKDFKSAILDTTVDTISQSGVENSATNVIPAGTIVVPTRMSVGKVAVLAVDMAINQDLKALLIKDEKIVDKRFLLRYLESREVYILQHAKGATVKGITLDVLKELDVPLPSIEEQKRIAAILDKADNLRRKRKQAIQLADEFQRAAFLDIYGDPVRNPNGWPVKKMREVIDFRGGSQPPKSVFVHEPQPGYVRLVQIRDFKTEKYITYIPEELAKRMFSKDDVMIARYGPPVFQILRGLEGSYNVALMKARPKGEITKEFIYRLLQLPAYHDVVVANSERTAGQSGVNLDLLNNLEVPLPPVHFQEKIITRISISEKISEKMDCFVCSSDELFHSLSQKAFSGDL